MGATYLTAYNDRKDIAESFADILPVYVKEFYGTSLARTWFHATSFHLFSDINFDLDEQGEWTGTWTTADDEQLDIDLKEDMGVTLRLDGLELLESNVHTHTITTDELSAASFGTSFGMRNQPGDEALQGTGSVTYPVENAGSPNGTTGLTA